MSNGIGTLSEKSLHAALKTWYAQPGDLAEQAVDGYVIDLKRGDWLIEFQTRNFSALKTKLSNLLGDHPVHLLHPIPQQKWIIRQDAAGNPLRRRKSPKRGNVYHAFKELLYVPHLLGHPNLTFSVLLTAQEEIWRNDGKGSWQRQGWSLHDHRLLAVNETITFRCMDDYVALLPADLPSPFTNKQLMAALQQPYQIAQKMTYTLRRAGGLAGVGKMGRSTLYQVVT